MDVSNLLSREPTPGGSTTAPVTTSAPANHPYLTRHAMASQGLQSLRTTMTPLSMSGSDPSASATLTPSTASTTKPKSVAFELRFPEAPDYRARLPMRVNIYPHDTTDSIITTVKNFYGLYDGPGGVRGVTFEDAQGHVLIARYENFHHAMTVIVRVVLEPSVPARTSSYGSASPIMPLDDEMQVGDGATMSRPTSRTMKKKGSALSQDDRVQALEPAGRLPGPPKRMGTNASFNDNLPPISDNDTGRAPSVTGSRKGKTEPLASAEISLDNIVEGGRRKRAKFESSELPLFVPPQVPVMASASPASPADRLTRPREPSSMPHPGLRSFAFPPLPSPQSHGIMLDTGPTNYSPFGPPIAMVSTPRHEHHLRHRPQPSQPNLRRSAGTNAAGILPTPDPTVASCISDEDVALQLMRLGDTSNISHGTRLSASTVDDGLSGIADAASSAGATTDGDGTELQSQSVDNNNTRIESSPIPMPGFVRGTHKHLDDILPSTDSTDPSGDEEAPTSQPIVNRRRQSAAPKTGSTTTSFASSAMPDTFMSELKTVVDSKTGLTVSSARASTNSRAKRAPASKSKATKSRATPTTKGKGKAAATATAPAVPAAPAVMAPSPTMPMSPASMAPHSRKPSASSSTVNFQHSLREDEEDLSAKPRCQRCRKSKKGCDRQRPCQRCKDAGIGPEGCVSEDETNGRRGRFGRHMGVAVKKGGRAAVPPTPTTTATATTSGPTTTLPTPTLAMESPFLNDDAATNLDQGRQEDMPPAVERGKKRKR
ncbi:MAG: hypothetical protein M1823_002420 [Watsoniomyces obsoletus]|nr:MAG: hypothetical protein M1823_002420 [Watsoniomyces obsoletus]